MIVLQLLQSGRYHSFWVGRMHFWAAQWIEVFTSIDICNIIELDYYKRERRSTCQKKSHSEPVYVHKFQKFVNEGPSKHSEPVYVQSFQKIVNEGLSNLNLFMFRDFRNQMKLMQLTELVIDRE